MKVMGTKRRNVVTTGGSTTQVLIIGIATEYLLLEVLCAGCYHRLLLREPASSLSVSAGSVPSISASSFPASIRDAKLNVVLQGFWSYANSGHIIVVKSMNFPLISSLSFPSQGSVCLSRECNDGKGKAKK